ncbi:cytochrome d ubiquinol oxidase subunit II [Kineosporia sp. J2-2]|uniref:Cytochrome d ubiquinol oxidase subunit II n=1 Tax=Kineosporia corallincola TaxID=2835133 RepID=A0ABS5TDI3_9ACTN|nr:cytochrome d ubiquinol oxidase subunit II [Kineosporia corallincola]MBT0769141.1 cytochrome d ubiquinol oxidase subunit II [Kineosporia corallincola]
MELVTFWFILISVLWIVYLTLEGFDFGVGMLLPFVSRDDTERRVLINTIAPVWDGNEVWLITAGVGIFAAFPEWYATLFSGFYLPLFLVIVALIIRGVSFEYRGTIESARWRRFWDGMIIAGSTLLALLWGVAFANIVAGVPIDADKHFTGTLFTLLNPYGLLGGVTTVLLFAFHGALWLGLRTTGEVRTRSIAIGAKLALPTIVVAAVFAVWTQLAHGKPWTWALVVIAAAALITAGYAALKQKEGIGFAGTAVAVAAAVALLFGSLFPDVMPSSTDAAFSLTVHNASSTHYTLVVMSVVTCIMLPVVIAYQSWSYWVFRHRIGVSHIPPGHGLPWATKKAPRTTQEAAS